MCIDIHDILFLYTYKVFSYIGILDLNDEKNFLKINRVIRYILIVFVWLLLFNIIILGFIHITMGINSLFFLLFSTPLIYEYTLFIHSPVAGAGRLEFGAITSKAALRKQWNEPDM